MTSRAAAVALLFAVLAVAVVFWRQRALDVPHLDCPSGQVFIDDAGVATCRPGQPLSVAQQLTVGQRIDLNHASAAELGLIPGLGPEAVAALVALRPDGGYHTWDEVDAVPGVGHERLAVLQRHAQIQLSDAGL